MKLSREERIEILVSSFEVLKSNIIGNGKELMKLVGKVSALDRDLAVDMWGSFYFEITQKS